jgi:hypothetical protein
MMDLASQLEAASKSYARGDFETAKRSLDEIVGASPGSPEAATDEAHPGISGSGQGSPSLWSGSLLSQG